MVRDAVLAADASIAIIKFSNIFLVRFSVFNLFVYDFTVSEIWRVSY